MTVKKIPLKENAAIRDFLTNRHNFIKITAQHRCKFFYIFRIRRLVLRKKAKLFFPPTLGMLSKATYISTNSTPVTHVENLPLFTFSTIHLKFNIGKHYTGTKQQASQLMMLTIFKFTVMDERQNLYFVRGDNPMCIYHYPETGLYVYASTRIDLDCGEILRIDRLGQQASETFTFTNMRWDYLWDYPAVPAKNTGTHAEQARESYLNDLKLVASCYGYTPQYIDYLLEEGFDFDSIEDSKPHRKSKCKERAGRYKLHAHCHSRLSFIRLICSRRFMYSNGEIPVCSLNILLNAYTLSKPSSCAISLMLA